MHCTNLRFNDKGQRYFPQMKILYQQNKIEFKISLEFLKM